MKIKDVIQYLDQWAPPALQESYDNCGLLAGDSQAEVTGVLVSLDCTEEIVEEAVRKGCNLIVSHHPLIFSGIKKLTGRNYVERTLLSAIRNNISLFAIHTNLDNVDSGVNAEIAKRLGLLNTRILSPKKNLLRKLTTFVPVADTMKVAEALFAAGAGNIGNYDECSFRVTGHGTFRGGENSNPVIGQKGMRHTEQEDRLEVIYPAYRERTILEALKAAHPYEEVAYDAVNLENAWKETGSGMIGELKQELSLDEFLKLVKTGLNAKVIRYTNVGFSKIRRVAVCGGSGSFLLQEAVQAGAQAFVTADLKYHQFFDSEGKILMADVGHFESEQFTIDLIVDRLKGKFTTFAVRKTENNTNPINYYT